MKAPSHYQKRGVSPDVRVQAEAIRDRKYPKLSNRQWAWEFLSRNKGYRLAYSMFMRAPDFVRDAIQSDVPQIPAKTPIEWLKLVPSPVSASTYEDWKREVTRLTHSNPVAPAFSDSRVEQVESFRDDLDPGPAYGLRRWVDPDDANVEVDDEFFVKPSILFAAPLVFIRPDKHSKVLAGVRVITKYCRKFEYDSEAVVLFDVSLPLDEQLRAAKRRLKRHAKGYAASGHHQPAQGNTRNRFSLLVKILDLRDLGLSLRQMCDFYPPSPAKRRAAHAPSLQRLEPSDNLEGRIKERLWTAERLRNHGYHALALLKEKKRR